MTAHCALYVPVDFFPSRAQLEPHCPDAYLEVKGFEEEAVIKWKGLEVKLSRMPPSSVASHLQGFIGYVKEHQGNAALETRILHTRAVYGCVIEPDFDEAGRVMRLVGGLTDAADGLAFIDGEVFGPGGRGLLLGEEKLVPPSAQRVLLRAQVLLALSLRGLLEEDAKGPHHERAEGLRQTLFDWAEETLSEELEPEEHQFLAASLGEPEEHLVIDAVWRAEGAQVLLWALGARPLPAFDRQENPYDVAQESGVMNELPSSLLHPKLVSVQTLEARRNTLLGLHWRLREVTREPGVVDFVKFAQSAWFGAFSIEGVPLVGGDLAVGGVAVSKLEPSKLELVNSIAHERHLAANWLIGVNVNYSAVNTPT